MNKAKARKQSCVFLAPAALPAADNAHRALRDFIHSLDDPSARSLLHSVLAEYDALQFERVEEGMAQMLARVRAV
jgi:hypothetical protein